MAFEHLIDKGEQLVEIVKKHVWDKLDFIEHVPWGYETHVKRDIMSMLRFFSSDEPTARHIRFSPDFFIIQQNPKILYLLEYKCTQSPLYSQFRIDKIARNSGKKSLQTENIGLWQRSAHENYAALRKIGVKVAVLNYIAYHQRLLLCDFIENIEVLYSDKVRGEKLVDRSGTDYVNFNAESMRSLPTFLSETHGISLKTVVPYFQNACMELQERLPIEYHPKDPKARGKNR